MMMDMVLLARTTTCITPRLFEHRNPLKEIRFSFVVCVVEASAMK